MVAKSYYACSPTYRLTHSLTHRIYVHLLANLLCHIFINTPTKYLFLSCWLTHSYIQFLFLSHKLKLIRTRAHTYHTHTHTHTFSLHLIHSPIKIYTQPFSLTPRMFTGNSKVIYSFFFFFKNPTNPALPLLSTKTDFRTRNLRFASRSYVVKYSMFAHKHRML